MVDQIAIRSSRTNDAIDEGWTLDTGYNRVTHRTGAFVMAYNVGDGIEAYVQERIRAAAPDMKADCLRIIAAHAGTLRLMNELYAANALVKVHKEIEAVATPEAKGCAE